jgi:hypothetical protein
MSGNGFYSLSLWERAGVRVLREGLIIFSLPVPLALTLTLSQREREHDENNR